MAYDPQTLSTVLVNTLKAHIRPIELNEIVKLIINHNPIMFDNLIQLDNQTKDDISVQVSSTKPIFYEIESNGIQWNGYFIYCNEPDDTGCVIFMNHNGLHILANPIGYERDNHNYIIISKTEFSDVWNPENKLMPYFTIIKKNN